MPATRSLSRARGRARLVAAGVVIPLAISGCTDRVARGRELYAKHGCAVCHGPNGRGDGPAAKTLSPPPRNLADERHYKEGSSEDAIAASIRRGVTGSGTMPAFPNLSQDDAQAIAAWIDSLQRNGGSSEKP
jgi:mono/diheme cytochrome c family protein